MTIKNSVYVDGTTGGYIALNKNLVKVNSIITKVNVLLSQPLNGNIYDLTNGNPLITTEGILSKLQIANGITFCLQPLLSSGEVVSFTITSYSYSVTGKLTIRISAVILGGLDVPLAWIR